MIRTHRVPGSEKRVMRPGREMRRVMAKSSRVKTPKFAEQARVVLKGSEKAAAENAVHVKATPSKSKVTVSVIVKRKEPLEYNKRAGRAYGPVRVSREEYKKHHAADPDALALVTAFAKE